MFSTVQDARRNFLIVWSRTLPCRGRKAPRTPLAQRVPREACSELTPSVPSLVSYFAVMVASCRPGGAHAAVGAERKGRRGLG